MTIQIVLVLLAFSGLAGITLGYVLRLLIALAQKGSLELEVKQKLLEAKEKASRIIEEAESRAKELTQELRAPLTEREEKLLKLEERLLKREEMLEERAQDLLQTEETLEKRENEVQNLRKEAEKVLQKKREVLAEISGLNEEEARKELFKEVEKTEESALLARLQKLELLGNERYEAEAKNILLSCIHRLSNASNADAMSLSIPLKNEEVKGKIIGKEGRNIKTFERVTGVEVIIDEAPDKIGLSSFDPLRRHIAKIALERLIEDGRIQPTKIEETVEKVRAEVDETIKKKGEEACFEVGISGIPPALVALLGRLHFRTSYGQNVLQHSIEMAHIAGMLASELSCDVHISKMGALFHDIGKAVDHEVSGTHVEIGRRVLEKFGVDKRVIQAMQSHHEEYPYETPEAKIVQAADAISAGRPGARRDTIERYLDRLSDLENIAKSFEGVEKVYAISAGREIRVFVNPGKVGDFAMHKLSRDIAEKIQKGLRFPGEIKVNVIRENRVVEFAR